MPSLWIAAIAAALWSAGCLYAARRLLAGRPPGPLAHDRLFAVAGVLSLGLAPWISLFVYNVDGSSGAGLVNVVIAALLFLASARARQRRRQPAADDQSPTPFRQKSAVLMVATLAVVYAVYFVATWNAPALSIPLFLAAASSVIVAATVGHALLALFHSPVGDADAPADERDREAERYGVKNAYLVLAWGIWAVPAACLLQSPLWMIANLAFLFAVLAEIVRYLSLLRFYRSGEA